MHSQRLTAPPLRPWVIAYKSGTVQAAHCDCMAGLGEACTHVAALLFAVEANVRACEMKTVTQEKAYWMLPSSLKKVKYSPIADIDFTSAKTKAKKLSQCIEDSQEASSSETMVCSHKTDIPPPSQPETDEFFSKLHATGTKSVILSITNPYSEEFVPVSMQGAFPKPLTDLYDESCLNLEYKDLLQKCKDVSISLTTEEANVIEEQTRGQAASKLWYRCRAGRITASRMRAVCHTQLTSPSRSLILAICNPLSIRFISKATEWGCRHEKTARETYLNIMKKKHDNFSVQDCGLFIHPQYPHLGATPDGIISCQCCGSGALEIKCPYCRRDNVFSGNNSDMKAFCLQVTEGGEWQLSRKHAYYYQVQTQIYVCQKNFADFVVWSQEDIHIERIPPCQEFWNDISRKASDFFNHAVLPELIGKHYSKAVDRTETDKSSTESDKHSDNEVWCLCKGKEDGKMIACDNSNCSIEWFHYACVGIKRKPKGTWYCPQCCSK